MAVVANVAGGTLPYNAPSSPASRVGVGDCAAPCTLREASLDHLVHSPPVSSPDNPFLYYTCNIR